MNTTVKKILLIALIAVLVTVIGVGAYFIAVNVDGIKIALAGGKVYSADDVLKAETEAFNNGLGDYQKYQRIIEQQKEQMQKIEREWSDKYAQMETHYKEEIDRYKQMLAEAQGYSKALENYVLEHFTLANPGMNSAELNALMLNAFEEMEVASLINKEFYETSLAEADRLLAAKDAEITAAKNSLADDDLDYYVFWKVVYNGIGLQRNDAKGCTEFTFTNPETGAKTVIANDIGTAVEARLVGSSFNAGSDTFDLEFENIATGERFTENVACDTSDYGSHPTAGPDENISQYGLTVPRDAQNGYSTYNPTTGYAITVNKKDFIGGTYYVIHHLSIPYEKLPNGNYRLSVGWNFLNEQVLYDYVHGLGGQGFLTLPVDRLTDEPELFFTTQKKAEGNPLVNLDGTDIYSANAINYWMATEWSPIFGKEQDNTKYLALKTTIETDGYFTTLERLSAERDALLLDKGRILENITQSTGALAKIRAKITGDLGGTLRTPEQLADAIAEAKED